MQTLEARLNYKFNNIELLKNALVHSSYANEVRGNTHSNERLEFLGDSVLSIIVADHIFHKYPKIKAVIPPAKVLRILPLLYRIP